MTADFDAEPLLKWIDTVDSFDGANFCGEILERFRKASVEERQRYEKAVRLNPIVWSTSKTSLFDFHLKSCPRDQYWREVLTIVALTRGFPDWRETIMWLESAWKQSSDSQLKLDELHAIGPLACRTNSHGVSGMSTQGLILNAFFNILKSPSESEVPAITSIMIDDDFAPQKYVIMCRTLHCCVAHLSEAEELRLAFTIVPDAHRDVAENQATGSFELEVQRRLYAAQSLANGCTGFLEFFEADLNRQNTLALRGTLLQWSKAAEQAASSFCIPTHESMLLRNSIQVCYQEMVKSHQEILNTKSRPALPGKEKARPAWWRRILGTP